MTIIGLDPIFKQEVKETKLSEEQQKVHTIAVARSAPKPCFPISEILTLMVFGYLLYNLLN